MFKKIMTRMILWIIPKAVDKIMKLLNKIVIKLEKSRQQVTNLKDKVKDDKLLDETEKLVTKITDHNTNFKKMIEEFDININKLKRMK